MPCSNLDRLRNITRKAIHPILTSTDHRRQQEKRKCNNDFTKCSLNASALLQS